MRLINHCPEIEDGARVDPSHYTVDEDRRNHFSCFS